MHTHSVRCLMNRWEKRFFNPLANYLNTVGDSNFGCVCLHASFFLALSMKLLRCLPPPWASTNGVSSSKLAECGMWCLVGCRQRISTLIETLVCCFLFFLILSWQQKKTYWPLDYTPGHYTKNQKKIPSVCSNTVKCLAKHVKSWPHKYS